MARLTRITLKGYKSIRDMSLELRPLNVLIGPNGAGKSNLISFFKLLRAMVEERLQAFIGISGGANGLLFYGAKRTSAVEAVLELDTQTAYEMHLQFAASDTLVFTAEDMRVHTARGPVTQHHRIVGGGNRETVLEQSVKDGNKAANDVCDTLSKLSVFHFHDTSGTSAMRQSGYLHDNKALRHDAGNLAAVLYRLRQIREPYYRRIVETVRQLAPWFDDFAIQPLELNPDNVRLHWRERNSDIVFGPHQLSDGTLRAMALVILLLQPVEDLPPLIVIDEPELGLHPYAIVIVASLIKQAACHCQVIVATQSAALLDQFEAEDVVVVERDDRESTFRRLAPEQLDDWLTEYSLSQLWEKNVLGGGPA